MNVETWQFLLGAFIASWVFGFVLGSKIRLFKQASEAIS